MSADTGINATKPSSKVKNAWKSKGISAITLKLPRASLGDLRIEGSNVSWPIILNIPRASLGDFKRSVMT
jgi:hypothetical protein